MKLISVVGARPNFMKIAPLCHAIAKHNLQNPQKALDHVLVHTGQHYDVRMSEAFFKSLNIPDPDINLEVGSGSHAEQLAYTMIEFEKVLVKHKPDWVIVVGDVNATLSCSVIAKRLNIKVCHIEAGLRSNDMTMPEEVNRLVTDRLSDLLLTPDKISSQNLLKEGTCPEKIHFVGNIMIDTLESNLKNAKEISIGEIITDNIVKGAVINTSVPEDYKYIVLTLHRPSNVDDKEIISPIIDFIVSEVVKEFKVIWPVHPRTRKQLQSFGLWDKIAKHDSVVLLEPIGYHEMLRLNLTARLMITDSGGLQEECCVLGTPCLTMRWNTERPITLREHGGASVLVGTNIERIKNEYEQTKKAIRKPNKPELWDGHTAERIVKIFSLK